MLLGVVVIVVVLFFVFVVVVVFCFVFVFVSWGVCVCVCVEGVGCLFKMLGQNLGFVHMVKTACILTGAGGG